MFPFSERVFSTLPEEVLSVDFVSDNEQVFAKFHHSQFTQAFL